MNKKIIFSAGGTGGHIFPAINLMKHFHKKGYEVLLVTDERGNNFIKKNSNYRSRVLKFETTTNKSFLKKISSFFIILNSLLKSIAILRKEKPNLIIGFGGYVSFPISFISKLYNLPLMIYEPNLVLGRTNKYLLPFAKKIFLSKTIEINFPNKYKSKVCLTGPILDKNIVNYQNFNEQDDKKENFSLLVLGGSQGAEIFGKIIPFVVNKIKNEGYDIEINQQCIKSQTDFLTDYYKKNNIKNYIFEFDKNILKLISSSDLAITRCGASTTAELTYTLTPFLAVPIPNSIDNHQLLNAKFYENKGCCWLLEQNNFNVENLFSLMIEIIKDKNKLKITRNSMKKVYNSKTYSVIENQIAKYI